MSHVGRIRVRNTKPPTLPGGRIRLRGQDVSVELIDSAGKATLIPARSMKLDVGVSGRKEYVTAELWVDVSELDLETEAEIFPHDTSDPD